MEDEVEQFISSDQFLCINNEGFESESEFNFMASNPKKRKLDAQEDMNIEEIFSKVICTFKDPIHILKDPIRLPCSGRISRYICKECMWMSNPNDKMFKCRFCSIKHVKQKVCIPENEKNEIKRLLKNNLNEIFEKFLDQIKTRIEAINGKL